MSRVMVIGCSGAGKSTLTKPLAQRLGLPLVHLDEHFWRPGWNRLSDSEWRAKVTELIAEERWVHDGNYKSTMALRMARADLVVFLDVPRWRCLWRIFKRRVRRQQHIPGCGDRVSWDFLTYVWRFPRDSRPQVLATLAAHTGDTRIVRLRTSAEVRQFLAELTLDAD
jgi:adenylate kinase family enzyme